MNTTPHQLLNSARRLLGDAPPGAAGSTARLAAFLSRQAVEDLIDARCFALTGRESTGGTMRSRLSILKSLDGEVSVVLVGAWYELSGYCHHHAYELSPTVSQVRGVVERISAWG